MLSAAYFPGLSSFYFIAVGSWRTCMCEPVCLCVCERVFYFIPFCHARTSGILLPSCCCCLGGSQSAVKELRLSCHPRRHFRSAQNFPLPFFAIFFAFFLPLHSGKFKRLPLYAKLNLMPRARPSTNVL